MVAIEIHDCSRKERILRIHFTCQLLDSNSYSFNEHFKPCEQIDEMENSYGAIGL